MFGGYGTICKRLVHWLQTRYSINSNMHCRSHRWSKSWTMPVGRHSLKHDDGCIMHIYQYTYSPIVCYRNNWIAMDSRSLRWRRDVCQQTPNHSDSHTIPVDYLCIPNIDRNTWHRRRRATLSCMDLLVWTSVRDNLQVEFNKTKKRREKKKNQFCFIFKVKWKHRVSGQIVPVFRLLFINHFQIILYECKLIAFVTRFSNFIIPCRAVDDIWLFHKRTNERMSSN